MPRSGGWRPMFHGGGRFILCCSLSGPAAAGDLGPTAAAVTASVALYRGTTCNGVRTAARYVTSCFVSGCVARGIV